MNVDVNTLNLEEIEVSHCAPKGDQDDQARSDIGRFENIFLLTVLTKTSIVEVAARKDTLDDLNFVQSAFRHKTNSRGENERNPSVKE